MTDISETYEIKQTHSAEEVKKNRAQKRADKKGKNVVATNNFNFYIPKKKR